MFFLVQLLVFSSFEFCATFNDLPSLMIANATMAIVIERAFFERIAIRRKQNPRWSYEKNVDIFAKAIRKAIKERTTDSGVGIEMSVFSNTNTNLAKDYMALLSVVSCDETWNLFERSRKEELVHLAITDADCPRLPISHGISVPVVESGNELSQIFFDLRMARIFNWKKINILHDRVFENDTIGRVLRSLSGEIPHNSNLGLASEFILSTQSTNSESATKRLIAKTLKKFPVTRRDEQHFLVIVNYDIVPLIIQVARSLRMLHPECQWLYVLPRVAKNSSIVMSFGGLLSEGENIAFIYNDTRFNQDCQAGVECYAKEMVSVLVGAVENSLKEEIELYERVTEEEFDAVRITKAERRQEIVEYIRAELFDNGKEERSSRKCGGCIVWKTMTGITWGNSFGQKQKTGVHHLIKVGHWTPGTGPSFEQHLFPHSIYGFRRKCLPIVTYHNPPWQYMKKSNETGKVKWEGFVFDIVDQLSKKLNFTYQLVEIDTASRKMSHLESGLINNRSDDSFGEKGQEFVRALTSSGEKIPDAVKELVSGGKVLMAACASTVNERLKMSVNFTIPISVQTYGLLTARPKQMSRVMLFASPYTTEAWACLAGGILLIGPILYLVHAYSPTRTNDVNGVSEGLDSPARCLWYIYGALLQQGGMHLPENDGARLIVGTWWLVVMVLVATYSGSLVAFLTFPRMHESISSIDDLLRHKDELTWSLPSKSFLEEYLSYGKSKYEALLGNENHPAERHNSSNYAKAISRVKDGKHVLIDWMSSLKMLTRIDNPLTNDGICHFSIGTEEFLEESIALLLPSNSPYLKLINNELKRMHESGLIGKWTADRMTLNDQCWEGSGLNRQVDNHKVDVWDMQGIFFVLFLGYTIAVFFLAWEFYSHFRKLTKERNLIRPFVQ